MIATNPALRDPRGGMDFLGPEFLTWLWWRAAEAPRFVHADGTEVFVHFDEHLEFRGERSAARRTVLRAGMPGGSAEARAALKSGKTLVAARLLLVRGEEERRITLKAEDLDVSGLKLPSADVLGGGPRSPSAGGESALDRLQASLEALDRAQDDLDLCFLAFLEVRCGPDWLGEVKKLRAWGARPSDDDRVQAAESARLSESAATPPSAP